MTVNNQVFQWDLERSRGVTLKQLCLVSSGSCKHSSAHWWLFLFSTSRETDLNSATV